MTPAPSFFGHSLPFRFFNPMIWAVWGYLLLLMVFDDLGTITENFFGQELVFCLLVTYALFESLRFGLRFLEQKKYHTPPLSIAFFMVFGGIALCLLVISLSVILYFMQFVGYTSIENFQTELVAFDLIFGFCGLLYSSVYAGFYLLFRQNQQLLSKEEAQQDRLKQQWQHQVQLLQPAFLYDSLETVLPFVKSIPEQAESLIDALSDLYRFQLQHQTQEPIEVKEELQVLEKGIELAKSKFGNGLQIGMDVSQPQSTDALLPAGSSLKAFQAIIAQNIIHANMPLKLSIYFSDGCLCFEHPLQEKLNARSDAAINELDKAFHQFSAEPFLLLKAYDSCLWKLPILSQTQEEEQRTLAFSGLVF